MSGKTTLTISDLLKAFFDISLTDNPSGDYPPWTEIKSAPHNNPVYLSAASAFVNPWFH